MAGVLDTIEVGVYRKGKLIATVVSDDMEGIRFLASLVTSSMNLRPEEYWFEIYQRSGLL